MKKLYSIAKFPIDNKCKHAFTKRKKTPAVSNTGITLRLKNI